MIFLDTDVVIDLLDGDQATVALLRRLQAEGEDVALTTVNVAELLRGEDAPAGPRYRETVARLLAASEAFALDEAAARRFGVLMSQLDRAGKRIPEVDGLIASVVLENGGRLVTRNRKHFERVPGLDIVSP